MILVLQKQKSKNLDLAVKKAEKLAENKDYIVHVVEDDNGGAWVHTHLISSIKNNF